MTIIVTIELPVDPDKVTSVDVVNRIKDLIESDSLHFRWERDEVPSKSMWSDWKEEPWLTLGEAVSKWENKRRAEMIWENKRRAEMIWENR